MDQSIHWQSIPAIIGQINHHLTLPLVVGCLPLPHIIVENVKHENTQQHIKEGRKFQKDTKDRVVSSSNRQPTSEYDSYKYSFTNRSPRKQLQGPPSQRLLQDSFFHLVQSFVESIHDHIASVRSYALLQI